MLSKKVPHSLRRVGMNRGLYNRLLFMGIWLKIIPPI